MLSIRQGSLADLDGMQSLFVDSIQSVCFHDYTAQQIEVWVSSVQNKQRWKNKIQTQYLLICEIESKMVGFASLDGTDYFDMLYVHVDYQSQGIARTLANRIESEAIDRGRKWISVDASKTAFGFFSKRTYKLITENQLTINGVLITNFKMTKELILS